MDGTPPHIDSELRAAYLHRLGLEVEPPSVAGLQRLHRRHVEVVPYETLWMHAGEGWGIAPADSAGRIALEGRGGYCYHLNGAFSELLRALGYAVTRHVGGVHGPDGPGAESVGNHLVLTVRDLPSEENASGIWYVDVGLGDALHEALPLAAGDYAQHPFRLALEETDSEFGDWHLTHDPSGGFAGMSWTATTTAMDAFAARHTQLSTASDSPFLRVCLAEKRDARGVEVVRGLVRSRVGDGAMTSEPLTDRSEWFGALADLFDLRFDHTAPETLDRLWDRALATHRAWDSAGRP